MRRRRTWIGWAVLAIALLGAACSSDSGDEARTASPDGATSTTSAVAGRPDGEAGAGSEASTADPTRGNDVKPSAGGDSDGGRGQPTTIARRTTPVDARFASACVKPGDAQTITVRTTPGSAVVYHAVYSDGKHAGDPDYYGGNHGGAANDSGVWSDTWVVGAGAPPGTVLVDVIAGRPQEEAGSVQGSFEVADAQGQCD